MIGTLEIGTALSIGLLGSVHCVGMCGPIALALPYQGLGKWKAFQEVAAYNSGRIATYAVVGALIGFLGKGFLVAGIQTQLALAIGIALVVVALFSISVETQLLKIPAVRRFHLWVTKTLALWMRKKGAFASFVIGLLNGLIPCGLVYMAVAGAVASGGIASGALFMVFFGLGTVPLMAFTAIAGQSLNLRWRNRLRRFAPVLMLVIAALFIIRGLQFQVPNDLRFWEEWKNIPMCH
ncbi:MAG: sulfite exporter TauE/SafE family protein [Haliscomenobacter sp.]|nr:sulfite exporter TauE/SafE family protein [Haliscomenobacter sp.]